MFSSRNLDTSAAKDSPFTPFRTKSRLTGGTPRSVARLSSKKKLGLGQSFHSSQIIDDTFQHRVETFGLSLPVLITETLTLSDRSTTEVTACIDPSGWAWLVGGRKLFIWRYKSSENTRSVQCKELTLPPSDLAHSAERVCLIVSEQDVQPVACVAVSPEGVVRYWPNIAFESNTAEISAELKGEECATVVNFQPHGCLLATTTSSLVLLEPIFGQATITCKLLKSSQGIFSGFSRRMSSFIFGSSQMQANETPLQAILAAPEDEFIDDDTEDKRSFYVLSNSNLSKWQVHTVGPEKLLYQVDAARLFREALARALWDQDSMHLPQLKTWLLDVKLTRDGVVVLGAGVNLESAQIVNYALAFLQTYSDSQPSNINKFNVLDFTHPYNGIDEDSVTAYKLLLPGEKSKDLFIYSSNSILLLHDDSALDKMDLKTSGDTLLGAGCCDGSAVFFSNTHGIFSVSTHKTEFGVLDESNNQVNSSSKADLSRMMYDTNKVSEMIVSNVDKAKLKGAFIASMNDNMDQVEAVMEDLLALAQPDPLTRESGLDKVVIEASIDIIDDTPSADPRWAESDRQDYSGSTSSVIITQQLKDKQKAHDYFVDFLKRAGLWDKLSVVSVDGTLKSTRLLLCEHVEKIEAAIAIRELHMEHSKLMDVCVRNLLDERKEKIPAALTHQDVFYQKISGIHEIAQALVDHETSFFRSDHPGKSILSLIRAVNAILIAMLHYALKYRQSSEDIYAGKAEDIPEYIPWTATSSMRSLISKQISLSLERALSESREVDVQGVIFENVVGLSDILMDGYAIQVKSLQSLPDRSEDCIRLEQKFERERHHLISPLLNHKQYDRAASLAEKYEDFEMLMKICDATENQERLQRYRIQFEDKGFTQFLFKWYMKEGKRGHLLAQPLTQGEELSKFLDTDNVKYLGWLHEIRRGNFNQAHQCLSELATMERNFLAKKKTLLSLSKLAALASEEDEDIIQESVDVINEDLDLVLQQELIPAEALENVGMDPNNMRVLSPEELIELYVGAHNVNPRALDFKQALDLLRWIDKEQDKQRYDELKLHIWSRAILVDDWTECDETDPLMTNKDKLFFETVDLVHLDGDLDTHLPDLNTLLGAQELSELTSQPQFLFLIKGGYEVINKTLSETSMMS